MPQGGGQSEWQRLQAAQRRETERRAREEAKLAKEAYLGSQQQAAGRPPGHVGLNPRVRGSSPWRRTRCPALSSPSLH
jgi:hypothetical protein